MSRFVLSHISPTRLDLVVTELLPDQSRASVQRWIAAGLVTVNGAAARGKQLVRAGDVIAVTPPTVLAPSPLAPESLPLDILHDDADLVVINKAPGMVVHPGAGQRQGTLVNALLARFPGMLGVGGVERPGIVHRLDQGTSGVMVIAKHDQAHRALVAQFAGRTTRKTYLAVCWGRPAAAGECALPIGRHPVDRKKMSTKNPRGKPALTRWTVQEFLGGHASLLQVEIATGRTHQIRVHLAALGNPLAGDATYGGMRQLSRLPADPAAAVRGFGRPALHAWRLGFIHPRTQTPCHFEAPPPDDFTALVKQLRS